MFEQRCSAFDLHESYNDPGGDHVARPCCRRLQQRRHRGRHHPVPGLVTVFSWRAVAFSAGGDGGGNPLELILDSSTLLQLGKLLPPVRNRLWDSRWPLRTSAKPSACYRPSTISVSRRANARDIASRNRNTVLASRIFIPAILATLHDSTRPRHLMSDEGDEGAAWETAGPRQGATQRAGGSFRLSVALPRPRPVTRDS
jgi:hypothetical protein